MNSSHTFVGQVAFGRFRSAWRMIGTLARKWPRLQRGCSLQLVGAHRQHPVRGGFAITLTGRLLFLRCRV